MRLLRNLGVISILTLVSRVAGLAREILTAARLGAGPVADTFFQAMTIPNTFRRVLAEGAFNAAFVPLYARQLEEKDRAEADRFASEALSFMATFTTLLVIAFQIFAPWLAYIFFPGRIGDPDGMMLAVLLLQIMMPYLLAMVVTALISGGLNSNGKFAAAAGAPVLLNIAMIGVLLFDLGPPEELVIWLAASVTASGVMQVALLWTAAMRAKLHLRLLPPKLTPRVKRLIALGIPGALAASAMQVNIVVTSSIATLEEGARSWLNYAERLYQLPLGMIGIAMGIALLPNLTRRFRSGDEKGGHFAMNRAIEIALALTLPASFAFLAIPELITAGLYQRGEFTRLDTSNTAIVLAIAGLGLPAFVLVKVLAPGFFAREDTRTPMRFALAAVAVNFVLALTLFFGGLGFIGLAIASSLAGWVNAGLLAITLRARGLLHIDKRLMTAMPRLLLASLIMAGTVWLLSGLVPGLVAAALPMLGLSWQTLISLGLVVFAGLAVFGGAGLALGAIKPSELAEALKPQRTSKTLPASDSRD
ncbi:murein biosynthesis integral membrane protein MurJ [Glycocaulis sp.]|uniref:murein biosynthesis integral membrane protein MurJ n=1 Tax=Glycocaulis sp. TaxID=1969725 RepID=UPI003D1CF5C7